MSFCIYDHNTVCTNKNNPCLFLSRCIEANNLLLNSPVHCDYHTELENSNDNNPNKLNPSDDDISIISHPSHYTEGRKYEPKDVIRDWKLNFNLGSAVKYISRAGRKDDIIKDLRKAHQFIQFEIDALEEERANHG